MNPTSTRSGSLPGLTSIDLFAGCGGLSLGLHRSGWQGLFAIEQDPMAFETLKRNLIDQDSPNRAYAHWPVWLQQDPINIEDLLSEDDFGKSLAELRGHIDLVAGGPPCQGFSVGGARNGDDDRNKLVGRFLEVVDAVDPSMVLVENVEGMARRFASKPSAEPKSVAENVLNDLDALGYDAGFTVVDASRFGVPQVRRRVIIAGIKRQSDQSTFHISDLEQELESIRSEHLDRYDLPLDRPPSAWEALHDLTGGKRIECPDSPRFETSIYTSALSPYARGMRQGTGASRIPNSHRYTVHGDKVRELYEDAHKTQPKGRLSKQYLLLNGTKKDKKVLLDPEAPASTITTHPDEFIHFSEPRNITVREMARLQSFPDSFTFHGRYTINGPRRRFDVARCSQVGNAVPPLLAEAVGLALRNLLVRRQTRPTEKSQPRLVHA